MASIRKQALAFVGMVLVFLVATGWWTGCGGAEIAVDGGGPDASQDAAVDAGRDAGPDADLDDGGGGGGDLQPGDPGEDGGDTTCVPATCVSLGVICGDHGDGCGANLPCGDCPTGSTCDQGQCVCVPETCQGLGVACGSHDDGCSGTVICSDCPAGETCQAGQCAPAQVDCSGIAANPAFELCESSATHCAGVFTDGSGCIAYCAAAGLTCSSRFGGEPNCQLEAVPIACDADNGHLSDWCVCGTGGVDPDCQVDPGNPPTQREKHYSQATFEPRSSWVLDCRDYAYTARFDEHEACDSQYQAGSGRGTGTFSFSVPRGMYDVYIEGRHTTNRNPAGALVTVTSAGQTHTAVIQQRDDAGLVWDLHGRSCLDGSVVVVMDSTVSAESDSIRSVRLTPN